MNLGTYSTINVKFDPLEEVVMILTLVCWISMKLVDGGHRAVKYSRVFGVQKEVFNEGTHFVIPWVETPIIYDVRAKPRNVASLTGTKGMLK